MERLKRGRLRVKLLTSRPLSFVDREVAMQRVALHGRHLLSLSPSRFLCSHHMSTDAQAAIARLRNSGFLKSKGLVGGKWVDSYDGKTIEVQNPATGDVIANVPCMGKRETDDAISSAYNTFYCMNCDPLLIYSLDLNSCK